MWLINAFLSFRVRKQSRSLRAGGLTRTYHVHVPRGHGPGKPAPVVLALHGATMNGPLMAWFSGLNHKADEAGFLAVYPNGTGSWWSHFWNAGNCCGPAVQAGVDDVAFLAALLDDLASAYWVDPHRVFVTGMSNGAMMAYRLASELSGRIAAIAPVGGTMVIEGCRPQRPVSVLHFHGTQDEYVPFTGGRGPKSITGVKYGSVDQSIRAWVRANGCREEPSTEVLPDGASDGTTVTVRTHGGGRDGSEVVLVVIDGGGHTWPGREPPTQVLGRSTKNVSANDLMWEFFQRHPLNPAPA
jgi:polyhydroxybutyrate depolymerase